MPYLKTMYQWSISIRSEYIINEINIIFVKALNQLRVHIKLTKVVTYVPLQRHFRNAEVYEEETNYI